MYEAVYTISHQPLPRKTLSMPSDLFAMVLLSSSASSLISRVMRFKAALLQYLENHGGGGFVGRNRGGDHYEVKLQKYLEDAMYVVR